MRMREEIATWILIYDIRIEAMLTDYAEENSKSTNTAPAGYDKRQCQKMCDE